MDKRLHNISARLSEYSVGKFDKRLAISKRLDDVDAVANGINMLGEELKSVTISRNYFNNIFNSVSDMVFILNTSGVIEDVNKTAEDKLKYKRGTLIGKTINDLHHGKLSFFKKMAGTLKKSGIGIINECNFITAEEEIIPVRNNISHFKDDHKRKLILFTATDIRFQVKMEKLIIRAIIDTQENERQRLAKDLHDSLIQQLSAIKFYISSTADIIKNSQQKRILLKSNEALAETITDMRNICFNLMPKTLEEFGLVKAVREFCNHFLNHKKADFVIRINRNLPSFSPELKIDLYRIIQEFISNAIKHGNATRIIISFKYYKKILKILLADNGKGFNTTGPEKGLGLQNMQSRIKSHNGEISMVSDAGIGTSFKINIPLNVLP